jgi:hypothetical protein
MRMIHGDFKIGEKCLRTGVYACVACRNAGSETTISLEVGGVFPLCARCRERGVEETDILWKESAPVTGRARGR